MAKSKVTGTAASIAEKWARNTSNAIPDIIRGIDGVTENPAEKAVAKKDKMVANFNTSMGNGKYEASMGKVTLSGWKDATKTKVQARLGTGVQAAISKRQAFDAHNINVLNAILPEIAAMPDMTLQEQAAKCLKLWQHMRDNSYKKS